MIEEIKEALEKATLGNWIVQPGDSYDAVFSSHKTLLTVVAGRVNHNDSYLLANTPTWLNYLLSEIDRQHDEFYNQVRIRDQDIEELNRKIAKDTDVVIEYALEKQKLLDELEKEKKVNENLIDRLDQADRTVLSYATSKGMNEELFKMMQEFDKRYRHSEFDFTKLQEEHTAMKAALERIADYRETLPADPETYQFAEAFLKVEDISQYAIYTLSNKEDTTCTDSTSTEQES